MCDYQPNFLAMHLEIRYRKRIFNKSDFFYEFKNLFNFKL